MSCRLRRLLFHVTSGRVFPGPGVIFAETQIALISELRNQSLCDSLFHTAAVFMSVSAVLKTAVGNERSKFDVVAVHFVDGHIPDFKLSDARSVTNPAAK